MRKFAKNTETTPHGGNIFTATKKRDVNTLNTNTIAFETESKAENVSASSFSNQAGDDDRALIDRLLGLELFKKNIDKLFEMEPKFNGSDLLKMARETFTDFLNKNVSQADVDNFIQKEKSKSFNFPENNKNTKDDDYLSEDYGNVSTLNTFFSINGTEGIVDKIKKEGEECIRMYELVVLREKIKKSNDYYDMTTSAHIFYNTVVQKDLDKLMLQKIDRESFKSIYDQSTNSFVITKHKTDYDDDAIFLSTYEKKLERLKKYKAIYEKRGGTTAVEQLNPAVVAKHVKEGINYKFKGGKQGTEDNQNLDFLEKQNLYSNNTYQIFNKGNKDTNEIDMNDVIQSKILGDCYLISSIASVAFKNPKYIDQMITYTPGDDFAIVTLYIPNKENQLEKKDIQVDFYFPVMPPSTTSVDKEINAGTPTTTSTAEMFPEKGNFAYASQGDGELWVMLIEKAYAQEIGSYEKIIGGNPADALAALTGVRSNEQVVEGTNKETLKEMLKNATQGDKAAIASTEKSNDGSTEFTINENSKDLTLYYSHSYSILSVAESMVELRNPHGGENAVFFISLDNFMKYFDNFYYSEVKMKTQPGAEPTK